MRIQTTLFQVVLTHGLHCPTTEIGQISVALRVRSIGRRFGFRKNRVFFFSLFHVFCLVVEVFS